MSGSASPGLSGLMGSRWNTVLLSAVNVKKKKNNVLGKAFHACTIATNEFVLFTALMKVNTWGYKLTWSNRLQNEHCLMQYPAI